MKTQMDITKRNFFRLLRIGVFDVNEQIEPMSSWKWYQVFHFAAMHGVTALIYDGITKCRDQFFMQLPPSLDDQWQVACHESETSNTQTTRILTELFSLLGGSMQVRPILVKDCAQAQLYGRTDHRTAQAIDIFYPFMTQRMKADRWALCHGEGASGNAQSTMSYQWRGVKVNHLHDVVTFTNSNNVKIMQSIIEQDVRENSPHTITIDGTVIELLSPTLQLLHILADVANHLLVDDSDLLLQLTDLGIFLRKEGDKVDFVKLQDWIGQLHMKRIAHLTGLLLNKLLGFAPNEVPFMQETAESDISQVVKDIFKPHPTQSWGFQQGANIFVRTTNSSAFLWHVTHSVRYFSYYPSECTSNFFQSIGHAFSNIEE